MPGDVGENERLAHLGVPNCHLVVGGRNGLEDVLHTLPYGQDLNGRGRIDLVGEGKVELGYVGCGESGRGRGVDPILVLAEEVETEGAGPGRSCTAGTAGEVFRD